MYSTDDLQNINTASKYFLFYDFETSSLNFFGQILEASFILTNCYFDPIPGYQADFLGQVSVLELPDPDTILANKINLEHNQAQGILEDRLAQSIYIFIEKCIADFGDYQVILIGHNSKRFDLTFLRTVLIRNGINPFFYGKLLYLDSIHIMKILIIEQPNLIPFDEKLGRWQLNLQNLARHFLDKDIVQEHSSKADLILLINLLKSVTTKTGIELSKIALFDDPTDYDQPFYVNMPAGVVESEQKILSIPFLVIDHDKNAILLLNLEKFDFKLDKSIVLYKNKKTDFLKIDYKKIPDKGIIEKSIQAKNEYSSIKLSNFFERTTCDIEQDIYRIGLDNINLLSSILHKQLDPHTNLDNDIVELWIRYKLRRHSPTNYKFKTTQERTRYNNKLADYANKRYIQGFNLSKNPEITEYSLPFKKLQEKLVTFLGAPNHKNLKRELRSLKQLYEQSYITTFLNEY